MEVKAIRTGKSYTRKDGQLALIFALTGLSEDQLSAYKEAQGEYYSEVQDGEWKGAPAYHSPTRMGTEKTGDQVSVGITDKGSVYVQLSETEANAKLAAQEAEREKARKPLTASQKEAIALGAVFSL